MTFRPAAFIVLFLAGSAAANPPVASYIYPAGGQRGTTTTVRVGGLFLHDRCGFALDGTGLTPSKTLLPTKPLWFEGPVLPLPDSQRQEDYPADMSGTVAIAKDAPLGSRRGWVFTSQGGAGGLVFVVGDLPEVVEKEVEGDAIPHPVKLPVTANGRIFPHDDTDLWEFEANAGQTITATAASRSLKSPLAAKLEILDSGGRVLAENMVHPVPGADESVKFTAPAKGTYRVRIGDAKAQGGPSHVYRLTLTTENVPEFHFPLKVPADGLKDALAPAAGLAAPVALNGRIEAPGAAQEWKVELKRTVRYTFDLQARRFDSPLAAVLAIHDASGKELAKVEGTDADPTTAFQPPTDGAFTIRVSERFRSRGGPNFIYRLRIADAAAVQPGFKLTTPFPVQNQGPPPDAVSVLRGANAKLRVNIERLGGFAGPIDLTVTGLPNGVTCKPAIVPANQNTAELTFEANAKAPLATAPITITGAASGGHVFATVLGLRMPEPKTLRATSVVPAERFLPESGTLFLTVGLPAPFKIVDDYVMTQAPRGEVYRRKFRIERDPGFTGAIEVRMADRQARHLQGVSGPVVTVAPSQTEVEYPATLPPWMELGRTCRVCVMAVGKVKDFDGTEHSVSFSSVNQNQQMIMVVGPGRLDVFLDKLTVRAEPGAEVRVPVRVTRARELSGPATVEAVIPEHWRGVTAAKLTIPADKSTGELVLKFGPDCGPFNLPLVVRAAVETKATPITAEAKLEIVK
ncbi:MAG: PPC domain-containing protein [Gemmataceae bacterium]